MKRSSPVLIAAAFFFSVIVLPVHVLSGDKPRITAPCTNCHKELDGVVRGKLTNLSRKASTLQVNVGKAAWLFGFDESTGFKNVKGIKGLRKDKEIAVSFESKGGKALAVEIAVKPEFEVPGEQLVDTASVKSLVEKSPVAEGYVLIDARPTPKYHEGHIRNAVSMPLFAFDKMKDKVLPPGKDILLVFYCGGVT